MDRDVLLVIVGAAIALASSLLTLAVSARLWRSRSGGQARREAPEAAEWTSRYIQAMREAAAARKPDADGGAGKPL